MPQPPKPTPETWQKKIKDFKFDGGIPLDEVTSFLRDQAPEINFVITRDAAEYPLPPVRLSSVTLEDAFTAIRIVSKGEIQISPESESMVSITRLERPNPFQPAIKQCVAYSLNRYLTGKPEQELPKLMKDVEDALERCWKMLGEANNQPYDRPALSLHAPTKMLIAVGAPDQLQVIEQIVRQLEAGAEPAGGGGGWSGQGGYGGTARGGYGGGMSGGGGFGGGGFGGAPGGGGGGGGFGGVPGGMGGGGGRFGGPEAPTPGTPPPRPSTNAPGPRK